MANYTKEISYYNAFWIKNVTSKATSGPSTSREIHFLPSFIGVPWAGVDLGFPKFPLTASATPPAVNTGVFTSVDVSNVVFQGDNQGTKWWFEESRITGGFNNTSNNLGIKAHIYTPNSEFTRRENALIYSGIYNKRTNFNRTNVFSDAENITRAVDPLYGSIQLIYAMDNDLTIFQENKVSRALIDKDAIYSAEGQPLKTQSNVVIGQITPYVGDYGISRNPESFGAFGFRRYFADKYRNAIMRLSRDGLTEISKYGMSDYFRDELEKLNDEPQVHLSKEYIVSSQLYTYPPQTGGALTPAPLGNYIQLATPGTDPFGEDIEIGALIDILPYGDPNPTPPDPVQTPSWQSTPFYVTGLGEEIGYNNSIQYVYINAPGPLGVSGFSPDSLGEVYKVRFRTLKKDLIIGEYDNYKSDYILSMQRSGSSKSEEETSDYYNTIAYNEDVKGWTTFYSYRPDTMISLKDNFYSTKNHELYVHYRNEKHNEFYGVTTPSSVEVVLNAQPSMSKNFKTVNYEGSSGWECVYFLSDKQRAVGGAAVSYQDISSLVNSYEEGLYYENNQPYRSGFNVKENKYYANLLQGQVQPRPGEVVFGNKMTGIKGYYATVSLRTDQSTDQGGYKELFAVSSEIVKSS